VKKLLSRNSKSEVCTANVPFCPTVVIKRATTEANAERAILNEIQLLTKMKHHNIIAIIGARITSSEPFIGSHPMNCIFLQYPYLFIYIILIFNLMYMSLMYSSRGAGRRHPSEHDRKRKWSSPARAGPRNRPSADLRSAVPPRRPESLCDDHPQRYYIYAFIHSLHTYSTFTWVRLQYHTYSNRFASWEYRVYFSVPIETVRLRNRHSDEEEAVPPEDLQDDQHRWV